MPPAPAQSTVHGGTVEVRTPDFGCSPRSQRGVREDGCEVNLHVELGRRGPRSSLGSLLAHNVVDWEVTDNYCPRRMEGNFSDCSEMLVLDKGRQRERKLKNKSKEFDVTQYNFNTGAYWIQITKDNGFYLMESSCFWC